MTFRPSRKFSVVIPNFDGMRHGVLEPCLKSLFKAIGDDAGGVEIIVADDSSGDESVPFVQENFSRVTVIESRERGGFVKNSNRGLRAARGELVFLANSDIEFSPGFLSALARHFEDENVFAVSPRLDGLDGSFQSGVNLGAFKDGHIFIWNESQTDLPERAGRPLPTLFAVGAAMLVRASIARSLGYFDEVYSPSNWEDIDISYRAWKRGHRVIYDPTVVLRHHHHRTIGAEYPPSRVERIAGRNEHIFVWRNTDDPAMLASHALRLPRRIIGKIRRGAGAYAMGTLRAAACLPRIVTERLSRPLAPACTDARIFAAIGDAFLTEIASHLKRRLRVLFVTQEPPWPADTGGKYRNAEILKRLAVAMELHVLAHGVGKPANAGTPVNAGTSAPDPRAVEVCASFQIVPREPRGIPWSARAKPATIIENSSPRMSEAIRTAVRDFAPDVICIDSFLMTAYVLEMDRATPVVYVEHDVGMIDYRGSYLWRKRSGGAARWAIEHAQLRRFRRRICDTVDEIVTLTDRDAEVLRSEGARAPISVSPTAVDSRTFRPRGRREYREAPPLLYLGHFPHHPNTDGVRWFHESIWPRFRVAAAGAKLTILGSSPGPDVLRLRVEDPAIDVPGFVEDLPGFMDADFIFIAPLRLGGGIRGKILQAMSMALPVVASRVAVSGLCPAAVEAIRVADSPDEWHAHLLELFERPDRRRSEGDRLREIAEQWYNWEKSTAEFGLALKRAVVRRMNFPVRSL